MVTPAFLLEPDLSDIQLSHEQWLYQSYRSVADNESSCKAETQCQTRCRDIDVTCTTKFKNLIVTTYRWRWIFLRYVARPTTISSRISRRQSTTPNFPLIPSPWRFSNIGQNRGTSLKNHLVKRSRLVPKALPQKQPWLLRMQRCMMSLHNYPRQLFRL